VKNGVCAVVMGSVRSLEIAPFNSRLIAHTISC